MIIWLASYPKSGNTWIRSFLASLLFNKNNKARSISKNALWDYYIDSDSYGIVECVHQIFLHAVI